MEKPSVYVHPRGLSFGSATRKGGARTTVFALGFHAAAPAAARFWPLDRPAPSEPAAPGCFSGTVTLRKLLLAAGDSSLACSFAYPGGASPSFATCPPPPAAALAARLARGAVASVVNAARYREAVSDHLDVLGRFLALRLKWDAHDSRVPPPPEYKDIGELAAAAQELWRLRGLSVPVPADFASLDACRRAADAVFAKAKVRADGYWRSRDRADASYPLYSWHWRDLKDPEPTRRILDRAAEILHQPPVRGRYRPDVRATARAMVAPVPVVEYDVSELSDPVRVLKGAMNAITYANFYRRHRLALALGRGGFQMMGAAVLLAALCDMAAFELFARAADSAACAGYLLPVLDCDKAWLPRARAVGRSQTRIVCQILAVTRESRWWEINEASRKYWFDPVLGRKMPLMNTDDGGRAMNLETLLDDDNQEGTIGPADLFAAVCGIQPWRVWTEGHMPASQYHATLSWLVRDLSSGVGWKVVYDPMSGRLGIENRGRASADPLKVPPPPRQVPRRKRAKKDWCPVPHGPGHKWPKSGVYEIVLLCYTRDGKYVPGDSKSRRPTDLYYAVGVPGGNYKNGHVHSGKIIDMLYKDIGALRVRWSGYHFITDDPPATSHEPSSII